MKKLLLLVGSVLFAFSSFAQDEDVTYYIQNAGFDEDLTFQADGSMKEAVSTTTSLSDRSWAYIAADSTVYARPKETSGQTRPDGRKMEAVNGFKGRIKGWTMESNGNFPSCEWTYFGSVSYDMTAEAVPVADDGSTYLQVAERPTEFEGGDGFVYLRAGWSNMALYKQVVKLPCAVYRLEYWTLNMNPNTSSVAQDLTQIVCRKDVFKDEEGTGLSAQVWTKHEFEFTPTAEFTMQFGYQAANAGSGGQPIVALDGIKLYKIGEADPIQLLESDISDLMAECQELSSQAGNMDYLGLAQQIADYEFELEEYFGGDQAELEAALKIGNEKLAKFRAAIAEISSVEAMLAKMDNLLQTTDYPGKAELEEAYKKILSYKESDLVEGVDVAEQILGAVAEATAAIKAYYMTQQGSIDNPADFTIFVQHPWFIDTDAEPTLVDGEWIFPKRYDEEGNDLYSEGSASSPNLNSEGWFIAGADGGDQRLNWQRGRSCWNAWNNNFTTTVAVGQTLEGLPNGYYTVSGDLCTQAGMLTNQHVYAESIAEKKTSSSMTFEGWDNNEWETLTMTADEKVLVVDGKLTIGAEGTGNGSGAAGWFLATNFHLYYLGEAPAEALKEAFDNKVVEAKELAANIHFAADKKAFLDSIALYSANTDYIAALTGLAAAMTEAQKSVAKYEEYIPSDGTIEGKTIPTVQNTLKKNGGEGYGAAEEIVEFAYNYVQNWIACDTATYTKFDAVVNVLKNYANTYTPAFQNAEQVAKSASAAGKAALQEIMDAQKAALIAEIRDLDTINEYITELNRVIAVVKKQNIVDDANATDYTAFIQNPNLEGEGGWNFNKGNGNTNTASGQWLDGTSTRYIDSYNAEGLQGFIATQLIKDLPNGTYTVKAYTRTPAEGAYILNAPAADTTFVEIPMNYYTTISSTGEDSIAVASDTHGPLWEQAKLNVEGEMAVTDPEYDFWSNVYNANSGNGRGWQIQEMAGIEVKNHELLIGTMAGTAASKTEKVFAGNWYSVGGWTLTLTAKGDNTGWEGPLATGISSTTINDNVADGIYTLSGVKTGKVQRGLNIVVRNGEVRKVMVK
ncbi:MAG: hypothetical protein K5683_02650 [Prevotella sp.]|nr:hypothetical protein [Prevotella sp.]